MKLMRLSHLMLNNVILFIVLIDNSHETSKIMNVFIYVLS
jgi:hypothetical protein